MSTKMPLTRDHKETVREMLQSRPGFAAAYLREGIEAFICGELEVSREILRDYINATMGFEKLSKRTGIPPKSLMRMFGPNGNPRSSNLVMVFDALKRHAGIELHLAAE
jgi:DNA-binding phage protein